MIRIGVKYFAFLTLLLTGASNLFAQEFLCQVTVQAPQNSGGGGDVQVYSQMQEAISKYINLRTWTEMKYEPYERIKVRLLITINDRPQVDYFRGTAQILLTRPVFNSSYESVVLNIQDKDFNVKYTPFTPLEFNENGFNDNLTSILNFYAYYLIGVDMDCMELNGGAEYYQKAKNVMNLAADQAREPGWKNFDGTRNRFWMLDGVINNSYAKIHNVWYVYHRQGLDQFHKDFTKSRSSVLATIRELDKLNQNNPGLYIIRMFLDAKQPEIVDIFKDAIITEKRELITIMGRLDPVNIDKYEAINKEGGGK